MLYEVITKSFARRRQNHQVSCTNPLFDIQAKTQEVNLFFDIQLDRHLCADITQWSVACKGKVNVVSAKPSYNFV